MGSNTTRGVYEQRFLAQKPIPVSMAMLSANKANDTDTITLLLKLEAMSEADSNLSADEIADIDKQLTRSANTFTEHSAAYSSIRAAVKASARANKKKKTADGLITIPASTLAKAKTAGLFTTEEEKGAHRSYLWQELDGEEFEELADYIKAVSTRSQELGLTTDSTDAEFAAAGVTNPMIHINQMMFGEYLAETEFDQNSLEYGMAITAFMEENGREPTKAEAAGLRSEEHVQAHRLAIEKANAASAGRSTDISHLIKANE